MTPVVETPCFVICPVFRATNDALPCAGSWFGTNHGFTQRGCTETMGLESEGLKASAVAVALTEVPEYLLPNKEKIRAKNTGRLLRCRDTATTGFMAKFTPRVEQSAFVAPALPTPYFTVTDVVGTAMPPIRFCCATVVAACVAALADPPQIVAHEPELLVGSPVIPEIEITLAAVNAAASAER